MGKDAQLPTVLVVDDEPSLRLVCRVNLELDGYRVLEAPNVAGAEQILLAGPSTSCRWTNVAGLWPRVDAEAARARRTWSCRHGSARLDEETNARPTALSPSRSGSRSCSRSSAAHRHLTVG
jgi:hypothetical protein